VRPVFAARSLFSAVVFGSLSSDGVSPTPPACFACA
jgi:hypothetical protein